MANKSGDIGTKTETAVVRVLQANGFPHAERRRLRGRDDPGDVTGTPGVAWSVKGGQAARTASDALIAQWLDRAEDMRANTQSDHAILVVARRGVGYDSAGRWWAIVRTEAAVCAVAGLPVRLYLHDACLLLRHAGYGTLPGRGILPGERRQEAVETLARALHDVTGAPAAGQLRRLPFDLLPDEAQVSLRRRAHDLIAHYGVHVEAHSGLKPPPNADWLETL